METPVPFGQVGGRSTEQVVGQRLSGRVIGLRGARNGLNYELFIGAPIHKPEGLRTARTTAGFSLSYSF